MNKKMQNIFASKRGAIQIMGLLMNPWIWVIVAVFLLGFWFTSLFMLGKIIGGRSGNRSSLWNDERNGKSKDGNLHDPYCTSCYVEPS